jgi:hypothetical protein
MENRPNYFICIEREKEKMKQKKRITKKAIFFSLKEWK